MAFKLEQVGKQRMPSRKTVRETAEEYASESFRQRIKSEARGFIDAGEDEDTLLRGALPGTVWQWVDEFNVLE